MDVPRRPTPATVSVKLTPAQQRVLMDVLRVHPAALQFKSDRTARKLVEAGLLIERVTDAAAGYQLSTTGFDKAARLAAQRVIDAVNEGKVSRDTQRGQAAAATEKGPPDQWPFPVSGHTW